MDRDAAERYSFSPEVQRLLELLGTAGGEDCLRPALRELLLNASDAIDKIRFLSLQEPAQLASQPELFLRVVADPDRGAISVWDSGIGMTKEELTVNFNCPERAGTRKLMAALGGGGRDGAAGSGFFSAFLAADRVTVATKHNGDQQWLWESLGSRGFLLVRDSGPPLRRGTLVTLHLRPAFWRWADPAVLRPLLTELASQMPFPVTLCPPAILHAAAAAAVNGAAAMRAGDGSPGGSPVGSPLRRARAQSPTAAAGAHDADLSLFRWLCGAPAARPLAAAVVDQAARTLTYSARLFVPPPGVAGSLALRCQGVTAPGAAQRLLPPYLQFVCGLVTYDEMPAEQPITPATVAALPAAELMQRHFTGALLAAMEQLASAHPAAYGELWRAYGGKLALGLLRESSPGLRAALTRLLRLPSTHTGLADGLTGLRDYLARMPPEQREIPWAAGLSVPTLLAEPAVAAAAADGREVLLVAPPLTAAEMEAVTEFEGLPLARLATGAAAAAGKAEMETRHHHAAPDVLPEDLTG